MKIDNRLLLPFVAPFALLILLRAVWWVAGAEWSDPGMAAFAAFFVGSVCGGCVAGAMFAEGKEIGHLTIGRTDKQPPTQGD